MKIEVAKPDLENALQVVSIGAASSGSDLTSHFVFRHREEDNGIEVLSNNSRIGCSMPVMGTKVSLSGDANAFTVESWRLNKWISAVSDSVLTLEFNEGIVKATSPKGTVKFQSLDPSQFAYWDKTLAEVETSTKVHAKRLQAALSHVKLFISDKDTTMPKLAVTEIKSGLLQATDKGALAVVALQDRKSPDEDPEAVLKESSLRVHGKDLGQVLAFLNQSGTEEVEVKEHDRCLFLVRHDGGVLSVGRPTHAFPDINLDVEENDPHFWDLSKEEVLSAIGSLAASASREDTRLTFNQIEPGVVGMSMTSTSGDVVTMRIDTEESGSVEDATPIPEKGFDVAYPYLLKLLGQWKSDTIRFGIYPQVDKNGKSKGGWVLFRESREDDSFLTLLVWLV